MTLRTLIVDDEYLARERLRQLLAPRSDVEVVGEAASVAGAVEAIGRFDPDLTLLDIKLPDGSGFEVLERVQPDAHVVFVTAYDDYAVRAFEVAAVDYILKPVRPERLAAALDRAKERPAPPRRASERLSSDDRICLEQSTSVRYSTVSKIIFIRASDDYTEVHLEGGDVVLVRERLRRWTKRLPDTFARIHRSTVVNLERAEALIRDPGGTWRMRLNGQQDLPVSRRAVRSLKERLARMSR